MTSQLIWISSLNDYEALWFVFGYKEALKVICYKCAIEQLLYGSSAIYHNPNKLFPEIVDYKIMGAERFNPQSAEPIK